MNATELAELLNDLPDQMIVSAYKHPRRDRAPAHADCASAPAARAGGQIAASHRTAAVPRRTVGAILAACLLFAVGFAAVMLHRNQDDLIPQNSQVDSFLEEVTAAATSAQITTAKPVTVTSLRTEPAATTMRKAATEQAVTNVTSSESASPVADNQTSVRTTSSAETVISSETSTIAAMTTVSENAVSMKSDAETLFEKYLDCYYIEETPYDTPESHVNPALLAKSELIQSADSMYYRANGKQYTAFWTPAADEHCSLNEWCDYADGTYTKRSYHDCVKVDGIYFGLQNDNTYAVAGADYDYFIEKGMTILNIPAELEGKPVTRIAKSAFSYAKYQWKDLQEIFLPDSIQRICADAFNRVFADCAADCKINMPQNIRYLGNAAFAEAMRAFGDTLILPDSIEYVHWNALQDHDSDNREYVKLIVPEHTFLTTDGYIRTLSGVDESVVTGDQMLSIIDAIPYVIENHPESIRH